MKLCFYASISFVAKNAFYYSIIDNLLRNFSFCPILGGCMRSLFLCVFFTICVAFSAHAAAPTLRIGIDAPYPPFAYTDPASGKLTGFDFDIAEALCRKINRTCEIRAVPFDNIIPSIVAGKLDIGVAGMAKSRNAKNSCSFLTSTFRSSSIF